MNVVHSQGVFSIVVKQVTSEFDVLKGGREFLRKEVEFLWRKVFYLYYTSDKEYFIVFEMFEGVFFFVDIPITTRNRSKFNHGSKHFPYSVFVYVIKLSMNSNCKNHYKNLGVQKKNNLMIQVSINIHIYE